MPPKKKLKADRHTADVEKGFSAQNLICTSQRIRLTTGNQDMLLRVQMEAPREVKGQSEWVMKVTEKGRQRERGCYSVAEKKSRHSGWWQVTDKRGTNRKRMLFNKREEQT